MYGRYSCPAGQYPYYPYYWPRPNAPPPRPLHFPVLPPNRIEVITSNQEPDFSFKYSNPLFPIPKPSGSNPTDSNSYCSNFNSSEPPLTIPPHSPSLLLHKHSDDELYYESIWSPETTSTPKFSASLHLSLQHIPLKSSCLSHRFCAGESNQTAHLSGFMSPIQDNYALFQPSDSITQRKDSIIEQSQDKMQPHEEKSPLRMNDKHSNSFLNQIEPTGSDCYLHPTQTNSSRDSPSPGSVSFDFPHPYSDSNFGTASTHDYQFISSPKRLSPQPSPLSHLENLVSPDAVTLSPPHSQMNSYPQVPCSVQRSSSCSPPSLVTPTSSPTRLFRRLSRKRSLPFSDSDSSEELPDVTFITESPDECCFIVSTTTPRMARELKLSPTNVTLYSCLQTIKHEQSPNSLISDITDKLLSADLSTEIERVSPTIQPTSSNTEASEPDIPPSEISTKLASVQTSDNVIKQVVNKRLRKMPLLSVTKTKTNTTPQLNINLNQTTTLSLRKNSTSRSGTNQYGDTPLHRLSQAGELRAVEHAVLEQKIPVNAQDNAGWTALHEACSCGHKQVAVFLLQHGANPNVVSNDGTAPVHDAVTSRDFNFLKLLVSFGADPLVTQGDISPLDMDTSDQIRAYLRDIAIQRGHYHPGLPTFPDIPISPTTFIKPACFSNSRQALQPDPQLLKQSIPPEVESDLYYISPMFETSQHSFLPTFSLPVSLNSGFQFVGNFYFLQDVLNRLEIDFEEFSLLLPDNSVFKFSRSGLFNCIRDTEYDLSHIFPETEKLEFVADTIQLKQLLGIQIQNMEV